MMDRNQPQPASLREQINTLSQQANQLHSGLMQKKPRDLPPGVVEELGTLASSLGRLAQQIASFEAEHNNLLALANTGDVINSSLELDEVLLIVMDNIVRLTRAERGFLMLRNERGQMETRMARNWEQESIKSSEAPTSRTIVQRVIDSGDPIITTNAQDHHRFVAPASSITLSL